MNYNAYYLEIINAQSNSRLYFIYTKYHRLITSIDHHIYSLPLRSAGKKITTEKDLEDICEQCVTEEIIKKEILIVFTLQNFKNKIIKKTKEVRAERIKITLTYFTNTIFYTLY